MTITATLFVCFALSVQAQPGHPNGDLIVVAPNQIVLDAQFDDWSNTTAALVDPVDAPRAFVDFGEARINHDDRFVHLLVDFGRTVNAQGLDGTAMILLDADGDPKTGTMQHGLAGVDVVIDLSPPQVKNPGAPGYGIGLRSTTYTPPPPTVESAKVATLSPYDIGFAFAPTHAGRRIEFRVERGAALPATPPLFIAERFSAKLVFVDLAGAVADETDIITHQLDEFAKADRSGATAQGDDPVRRGSSAQLRVMNWNVQVGAIFTKPEPFGRTLAALKPDVILFQELDDENSAQQVQSFLQSNLTPGEGKKWNVVFGAGGGDLRCAVASTFNLHECPALAMIAMPDRPDRSLRATGAVIEIEGKKLLAVSVHLKCCGRSGGPEDQQRLLEVQLIQQAIRAAMSSDGFDGLIVAGDMNLVGARDPLESLAAGLDLDRSALHVAEPYQIDGLSNATWSDPLQPFVPGRLDYMLFTNSSLSTDNSFVFDSRDLAAKWLEHHHVQPADTTAASDHFPVVVDLHWMSSKR
jgi:endonuclease/exonuclease/phosphatase family metal-dependent hydrolase